MQPGRQMILNFHGIGTPHAGVDASERPYWVSEKQFIEICDMVQRRDDADDIQWTFDDGNRSDLDVGALALAERGRKAVFFLLTGRFDDPNYLDHDQTRRLVAMGMEVGLHGRDHVDWRKVDSAELDAETVDARNILAAVAGQAVNQVAIPFGAYNRRIISHLVKCGFSKINTSDGGPSRPEQRILSRTSIRSDMTLERVAELIDDRISPRRKIRRQASTFVRRHVL
jgi:peptidoglycan/xylan/chitin deacetylase (PgdA/CDA1 family)